MLLYVIEKGRFPVNVGSDYRPSYDMVECRVGSNNHQPATFKHLFEFERILHGPPRHLQHFLSEHTLEGRWRWRFSSKINPIHSLQTALVSVTAIVNCMIPIVLVPPMTIISDGTTDVDYRDHYQTALESSLGIVTTLMERAITAYNYRVTPSSAFRTDPCLFPRYVSYSIEDYSLGNGECYPRQEGKRMVFRALQALQLIESSKQKSTFIKNAATPPSAQKRQTTLKQNAAGQELVQLPVHGNRTEPHQQKIVNLKELKANRAAAQQLDQECLAQQPLPVEGFEEYHASNLLQCEWSEYGVAASDSLQAYTATLLFHCIDHRALTIGDTVVLLHKLRHFDHFTNLGLLNRSHLHYSVDHIHEHIVYLSLLALFHRHCGSKVTSRQKSSY